MENIIIFANWKIIVNVRQQIPISLFNSTHKIGENVYFNTVDISGIFNIYRFNRFNANNTLTLNVQYYYLGQWNENTDYDTFYYLGVTPSSNNYNCLSSVFSTDRTSFCIKVNVSNKTCTNFNIINSRLWQ